LIIETGQTDKTEGNDKHNGEAIAYFALLRGIAVLARNE
jgi:hypothetical protein